MMTSLNCPTCGAAVSLPANQAIAKCPYCGNTIMLPQAARADDLHTAPVVRIDSTIQPLLDLESDQTAMASSVLKSTMPWVLGGTVALPLVITAITFVLIICVFGFMMLSFGSFFTMFR